MRIDFNISQTELGKFRTSCEAAIRNVGTGTKAAATEACIGIMSDSLSQVPFDTGTLYNSAFFGVSRRTDITSYRYGAIMGYGDIEHLASTIDFGPIEWLKDPDNGVNPKNGFQASTYAAKVHEDLDMPHPHGGKAKFLEDPVRNWASGRFARTAMKYWGQAINMSERRGFSRRTAWGRPTGKFSFYSYKAFNVNMVERGSSVQRGGKTVYKGAD